MSNYIMYLLDDLLALVLICHLGLPMFYIYKFYTDKKESQTINIIYILGYSIFGFLFLILISILMGFYSMDRLYKGLKLYKKLNR